MPVSGTTVRAPGDDHALHTLRLGVGAAIAVGFCTRPLALPLATYAPVAALIGHPGWNMAGQMEYDAMINFYKNTASRAA